MKLPIIRHSLICAVIGRILGCCAPVCIADNDDGSLLKQAEDLVKQAWNPGGDPPSNDKRTALLNQAIELALKEPDHRLRGTRMEAIRLMRAAVEEIKKGDPDNKATSDIQDANRALRDAIEGAEAH